MTKMCTKAKFWMNKDDFHIKHIDMNIVVLYANRGYEW
jgi:hypothetical protein